MPQVTSIQQIIEDSLLRGNRCYFLTHDEANDSFPAIKGEQWDDTRSIDAELLETLLTDKNLPYKPEHPLSLRGMRIKGDLDLSRKCLVREVFFIDCHFDGSVVLDKASLSTLEIINCSLQSFSANGVLMDGDLMLTGSEVKEYIQLSKSKIEGNDSIRGWWQCMAVIGRVRQSTAE